MLSSRISQEQDSDLELRKVVQVGLTSGKTARARELFEQSNMVSTGDEPRERQESIGTLLSKLLKRI